MSDLATRSAAPLAPVVTPEAIQEAVAKPLRLLPADWRPVVWEWWAGWSHLVESQLALAVRLRRWIGERGLTLDDARNAFAALNRPEREATIRFKGDLLAELAMEVARVLARRKSLEDQERRRREDAEFAAGKVRRITESIGTEKP